MTDCANAAPTAVIAHPRPDAIALLAPSPDRS